MRIISLGKGAFSFLLLMGIRPSEGADPKPLLAKYCNSPSLQILDARYVAGTEHLLTAALLASRSWDSGEQLTKVPANELLLYASARRQIRDAIGTMGVKEGSSAWIAVAVCEREEPLAALESDLLAIGSEEDSFLEVDDARCASVASLFGISDAEIESARPITGSRQSAIASLVMEKVSLSDLYR